MSLLNHSMLFILIGLGITMVLLFMAVKYVPQGQQWTVERFGKYIRTLTPGLHIIIPAVDDIGNKLNMMEQTIDIFDRYTITRDNATVHMDGVIFYQIVNAAQAAYQVNHLNYALRRLAMTNLWNVVGSTVFDELLSKRDVISTQVLKNIDQATSTWGVKILRFEIKYILPSKQLIDFISVQMIAERTKRALILEAEGKKQATILRAQGTKQAIILEAEAYKAATYRDAEARERFAQAEGRAIEVISNAISRGQMQSLNYLIAIKYVEAINHLANSENGKEMLMALETAGAINAISGLKEIVKFATLKPDENENPQS